QASAAGRSFGIKVARDYAKRRARVRYPCWNEVWSRQQPTKRGTHKAVALAHGFPLHAVAKAGRSFGIDVQREYGRTVLDKQRPYWNAAWLRKELGAHDTLREVARQHGFVYERVLAAARELGITARA